ncbi:7-carboxy-7-deazaguanine synthase [Candidatus Parabeggiatoa sp. HSG14]|uniref:7-carboxy-7-deazaguanine synthase n=1 Tax=Candidatus Parabeggiatoa sp. HSG14 TaxID=3055593 RepID=UPI0025A71FCC|nr:7-carboxy-7-deazaguanine synthase [Thiotrichales bacterium HSG14]
MSYTVKEIFYSLQGEGLHTGRAAVFCRFAGCNLWSGNEQDRAKAVCQFCDTDFVDTNGGGKFISAQLLVEKVAATWETKKTEKSNNCPFVICTGGEPLLQLDTSLIDAFHQAGFEIAIETNGTLPAPYGIDWVCVSPKAHTSLVLKSGDELKLIYPQTDALPESFQQFNFKYFFLQPMDGPKRDVNTQLALRYCLEHPKWRLSLQTHKLLGIL